MFGHGAVESIGVGEDLQARLREVEAANRRLERDADAMRARIECDAELLEALEDMVKVARADGWHEATTGRQLILKGACEAISQARAARRRK